MCISSRPDASQSTRAARAKLSGDIDLAAVHSMPLEQLQHYSPMMAAKKKKGETMNENNDFLIDSQVL